MSTADRVPDTEPVRTCVGCRRRAPARALVRINRVGDAIVLDGPSHGRGAWLCRDGDGDGVVAGCLDLALHRGGFERAWRRPLGDAERNAIEAAANGAARRRGGH